LHGKNKNNWRHPVQAALLKVFSGGGLILHTCNLPTTHL